MTETEQVFDFPGGRVISNQADITLVNNTALTTRITVPADMRWFFWGGSSLNADNVGRRLEVTIDDGTDILHYVYDGDVGAGVRSTFPANQDSQRNSQGLPFPLSPGWRINFIFSAGGASAGGTGEIAAVVTQLRVGA